MSRQPGLFGLRPVPAGHKWQMQMSSYVDLKSLPPIPAGAFGHLDKLQGDWGILANDQLGCCVVSGAEHETMLWTAESGYTQAVFNDQVTIENYELLGGYRPGNPDTDNGCDMMHTAELRMRRGIRDAAGRTHKIGVALELECGPNYFNLDQFWYASYLFDGVGLGIAVTPDMQDDFADELPWGAGSFNPNNVIGGHYVPAVAREEVDIDGKKYLGATVITWGHKQIVTAEGLKAITDTVLVYATPEKLHAGKDLEGLSWSDMKADIRKLQNVGALRGIHRL